MTRYGVILPKTSFDGGDGWPPPRVRTLEPHAGVEVLDTPCRSALSPLFAGDRARCSGGAS